MQKLIPISEAAKVLDVSIDTVRRYDKLGILHSTRPGGKIRYFDLEELKAVKSSKPIVARTDHFPVTKVNASKSGGLKRIGLLLVKILIILLTILTILFLLFPEQMARLLTSFM